MTVCNYYLQRLYVFYETFRDVKRHVIRVFDGCCRSV